MIESVLGFEVGAYLCGHGFVAGQWITRHRMHAEEGGTGDKPNGYQTQDDALSEILEHQPLFSGWMAVAMSYSLPVSM